MLTFYFRVMNIQELIIAFVDRDFIRNCTKMASMEPLWKWLIRNIVTILVYIMRMYTGACDVRSDASLALVPHHVWRHTIGHFVYHC